MVQQRQKQHRPCSSRDVVVSDSAGGVLHGRVQCQMYLELAARPTAGRQAARQWPPVSADACPMWRMDGGLTSV